MNKNFEETCRVYIISLSKTILFLFYPSLGTLKLNIENTYKLTYCAKI